ERASRIGTGQPLITEVSPIANNHPAIIHPHEADVRVEDKNEIGMRPETFEWYRAGRVPVGLAVGVNGVKFVNHDADPVPLSPRLADLCSLRPFDLIHGVGLG